MGNRIVVGIDGAPASVVAARWAAQESVLRGCRLDLLHAQDDSRTDDAVDGVQPGPLLDAQMAIEAEWPELDVRFVASSSDRCEALVAASASAELVVLGTNGRADLSRSLLGTVGQRVATQAHCPVVIVPPDPVVVDRPRGGAILVGLAATPTAELALRLALAEARLQHCAVVGLRADREAESTALAQLIDRVTRAAPDVPFGVVESDAEPAEALAESARNSRMVFLGCHHDDDQWSARVGPVSAALLGRIACPAVLVGEAKPVTDGLLLPRRILPV